jgi:aspartate carbamoyltransferase catalytic subunit
MIRKDLILLSDLSKNDIEQILNRGDYWADNLNARISHNPRTVDNPVICNLFFESSTRTRFSFEVAAKRLGYHVLNFDPQSSSTQKGESLYDTLKTLEAMGVTVAIIRTEQENILQEIAPKLNLAIINAGAGANEHPTQGLLDLLTMRQHFGTIEGLTVAIIGDVKHSRVANSNIIGLGKFGAKVLLAGPAEWMPASDAIPEHASITSVDYAVANADVVMMLRVQKERHVVSNTLRDSYLDAFGLTQERYAMMKPNSVIMHPAPFNRDIEIDGDLVESKNSLIYKQVSNGVAVRMAVLEKALGN